jgi:hypothetical protein
VGTSSHYGLQKIDANTPLSANDYAFGRTNIDTIDRLIYRLNNVLFGEGFGLDTPTSPPTCFVSTSGGMIPAGRTVRYRFSYVDQFGAETAASPEVSVSTPSPVSAPGSPGVVAFSSGGTLSAGTYFYALSAYVGSSTVETPVGPRAYNTFPSGSANRMVLNLPSLPSGATGFNVYRRGPGESEYNFVDFINMTLATPPSTYNDTGTTSPNCDRHPTNINKTYSTNSVVVSLPGATPSVPENATWKLYRTYESGNYSSSLLAWVVTTTSQDSGIISPTFTDVGSATTAGQPPSVNSTLTDNSDLISLLDWADSATPNLISRLEDLEAGGGGGGGGNVTELFHTTFSSLAGWSVTSDPDFNVAIEPGWNSAGSNLSEPYRLVCYTPTPNVLQSELRTGYVWRNLPFSWSDHDSVTFNLMFSIMDMPYALERGSCVRVFSLTNGEGDYIAIDWKRDEHDWYGMDNWDGYGYYRLSYSINGIEDAVFVEDRPTEGHYPYHYRYQHLALVINNYYTDFGSRSLNYDQFAYLSPPTIELFYGTDRSDGPSLERAATFAMPLFHAEAATPSSELDTINLGLIDYFIDPGFNSPMPVSHPLRSSDQFLSVAVDEMWIETHRRDLVFDRPRALVTQHNFAADAHPLLLRTAAGHCRDDSPIPGSFTEIGYLSWLSLYPLLLSGSRFMLEAYLVYDSDTDEDMDIQFLFHNHLQEDISTRFGGSPFIGSFMVTPDPVAEGTVYDILDIVSLPGSGVGQKRAVRILGSIMFNTSNAATPWPFGVDTFLTLTNRKSVDLATPNTFVYGESWVRLTGNDSSGYV